MGFIINSIDQKQHINLSREAWKIIDEDIQNFYIETRPNLSGFLNRVFENFYEEAQASISYRMDQLYDMIEATFEDALFNQYDDDIKQDVMNRIISVKERFLLEKVKEYPKGEGRKFRINNQNLTILEESIDDTYYNGSAGLYLKALFEEYARLPYSKREQIFSKKRPIQ